MRYVAITAPLLLALFPLTHAVAQEIPGGSIGAFPSWPKSDAATVAKGKVAFSANCGSCHGEDARGGANNGPNLIRSDVFMKDRLGENVAEFLRTSTSSQHKFTLSNEVVASMAAYVHAFGINSRDPGRMRPPTILIGDAQAGKTYFEAKCGACHSATGDLKGIASRITEPRSLQQNWLMPVVAGGRGGRAGSRYKPITVTVTLPSGKVEGVLGRVDDFIVTLTQADGMQRSFRRDGDIPKVEIHDPMKAHKDLLGAYTDRDIHNVTAYLVTLK